MAITRRELIKTSLPVLAGVSIGGLSVGCGGATMPRTAVTHGPLEGLAMGATRLEAYDVFLVRTEEGVAAISGQCTHAGCGVAPRGEGFHCGCHGSEFTLDGTVTRGPASEPLPWFAVRIEGGDVVVDPSQTVPQGTYTPIE
ncbi:MAG: Rieske (2Fe-2S) protein [Sandaracinaceae bacterium]|nr:Rieske (2Fe-2S) protein [Sandaracinaceae bacterium]